MTAFANHFAFEFKTGLRNPSLFFINYLFPLGFYAMLGLIMTQVNPLFKETMLPAMVTFAVIASTLLGLPGPLVDAREAGVFRSFKINGVPAFSILAAPVITTLFHGLIAATIVAVTAGPLFGGATPLHWGAVAWITVLTAFTFASLGALIGVVAANSRATLLLSQAIFLPSMLLGGMMIPLSVLPASVQPFAGLLPTSHAMQAFVGFAYGQPTVFNPTTSALVLLAGGVLAFGLAIYLFNWDSRNQARRGHPLMGLLALVPFVVGALLR
ncbi:MAG: ABC transporter permease [Chloroflexi bacterium]|nr:ABC transporter permease [Chloroflexota bacterium]